MGQNSVTGMYHQRGDGGRVKDADKIGTGFSKSFVHYYVCLGDMRLQACANHCTERQRTIFRDQLSPFSTNSTHAIRHV